MEEEEEPSQINATRLGIVSSWRGAGAKRRESAAIGFSGRRQRIRTALTVLNAWLSSSAFNPTGDASQLYDD